MKKFVKILYVAPDDAPMRCWNVKYKIEVVWGLSQALDAISWFIPDVVISEINIPLSYGKPQARAGLKLVERVRATNPNIKFIMLTDNTKPETIIHAMRAGAAELIVKGSASDSSEYLEESIRRCLEPSRPLTVFLCHSAGDKRAVRILYSKLLDFGCDPWLDEEKLLPGQDWELEIKRTVRASDIVLVCLSQGSVNKEGFVQREIKMALDAAEEKPEGITFLVPVRLEDCPVPERLRRWHYVNLFEKTGHTRLLGTLRERASALGRDEIIAF